MYITEFIFDCQTASIKCWHYLISTENVVKIFNEDILEVFFEMQDKICHAQRVI